MIAFAVPETFLNKRHQACLVCGGKDRCRYTDWMGTGSVYCNNCGSMDGIDFLQRWTGQSFVDLAKSIRSILGETMAKPEPKVDTVKLKKSLTETWQASKPMSKGDPVHRYLFNRGLSGIPFSEIQGLRYHPSLPYYETQGDKPVKTGEHPAMVALIMTVQAKAASLHVTYLTPSGEKADVPQVRKVKTPVYKFKGGAVRLGTPKPGQTICVAEGIETALSLWKLHPEVCPWACLNANNMESFVPPEFQAIMIGGDNDESFTGQAAAFALAKRLRQDKKKQVTVMIPETAGTDWNDVVRA